MPDRTAAGRVRAGRRGAAVDGGARAGGCAGLARRVTGMSAPSSASVADLVSRRVLEALDEHTRALTAAGTALEELLVPARDLLRGGKRMRARLCAAGWSAFSDEPAGPGSPPVLAGSALELFQGAALVHDDVMDGSLTRRGMPAVHRRLAADHAAAGRVGDADRHGEAGAILLGDLLLTLASMEVDRARAGLPATAGARGRAVWDLLTSEVAVGQYLDMRAQSMPWHATDGSGVEQSLAVVRMKSARYSVEHPLVLGAALAGADDAALDRLRRVGLPLGEAFQLRDDVLGVFGDPAVTGKPAGDDLREGKRTVLVALAMDRADDAQRARLRADVGRADLTADEVGELQDVLVASGAVAAHEELIAERLAAGLAALDEAGLPADVTAQIGRLAEALAARTA
jgi:geranylgeranyl diphosphate synthase type I